MRIPVKSFLAAVSVVGIMCFGAAAQALPDTTLSVLPNGNVVFTHRNGAKTMLNYYFGSLYLDYTNLGGSYGWFRANQVTVNGDLAVLGGKYFIHPHPTDESKIIKYIAIESGEALTLARGTAKTVNGEATVALPEHFSLSTSKDVPVTVILTPIGAPALLYTKQYSKEKIIVAVKKSDLTAFGDVEFAFQVTGVRDGFEKQDVIDNVENFYSPSKKKQTAGSDVQKRIDALIKKIKAITEAK